MKKIFTLLVSAVMAGSAMAMPAVPAMQAHASRQPAQAAHIDGHFNMQATSTELPEGMKRLMTDGQGVTWNAGVKNMGTAIDMLGLYQSTPGDIDFDAWPYYLVNIFTINQSQTCSMSYYLMWPSRAAIYDAAINSDGTVNWTVADAAFGSHAAACLPASIDDVRAFMSNAFPVLAGLYAFPCIIQNDVLGITMTWNGDKTKSMKPCSITSNGISTDGSFLTWEQYDPDFDACTFNFDIKLGTPDGYGDITGTVTNANYVLNGTPSILGFSSKVLNFDELHVFNCGLTDEWSTYGMGYEEDFTPVQRYYLAWPDITVSYMGQNTSTGEMVYSWNEEDTKGGVLLQEMVPIAARSQDYSMTYFMAALYLGENEPLEGIWTMPTPKYTMDDKYNITSWESVPTSHELIPCMNYGVAEQDGFYGIYSAFYVYPDPGLSFIGFGDKTLGFNFKFSQEGWGDSIFTGYFNDQYIYHPDMNNWDTMELRAAVGTADANAIEIDSAAVEVVESNAPVVSTQYFNLQGQRLNVAPQQGIFIQRDIKADGTVKTAKIAK